MRVGSTAIPTDVRTPFPHNNHHIHISHSGLAHDLLSLAPAQPEVLDAVVDMALTAAANFGARPYQGAAERGGGAMVPAAAGRKRGAAAMAVAVGEEEDPARAVGGAMRCVVGLDGRKRTRPHNEKAGLRTDQPTTENNILNPHFQRHKRRAELKQRCFLAARDAVRWLLDPVGRGAGPGRAQVCVWLCVWSCLFNCVFFCVCALDG